MTMFWDTLPWVGLVLLVSILYLMPTLVAAARKHHNSTAIFVLNLFLGWSFVGWVISLVWACTAKKEVK